MCRKTVVNSVAFAVVYFYVTKHNFLHVMSFQQIIGIIRNPCIVQLLKVDTTYLR